MTHTKPSKRVYELCVFVTAAGQAVNAEALSGLEPGVLLRASALLVSHWAVQSKVAVQLIKRILPP